MKVAYTTDLTNDVNSVPSAVPMKFTSDGTTYSTYMECYNSVLKAEF